MHPDSIWRWESLKCLSGEDVAMVTAAMVLAGCKWPSGLSCWTLCPESSGWVPQAVDPQQRVLFLDTSQLTEAQEVRAGDTLNNSGEAAIVLRLTKALLSAGLPATSLGLISPFTSQVSCPMLLTIEPP